MAQFKALAVIFHSLDLTFDGKRYTDQINPPGTTDDFLGKAKTGLSKLPGRLKAMNPNVNLTITPYDNYNPKVLRELNLEEFRDSAGKVTTRRPFIYPSDFERIMKLTDPSFSLSWGQYDTIFVIVPFTNPGMIAWQQGNPSVHGLPGLAVYHAGKMKGAAMAFLPAHWDLSKYDGDGLQHEWLHGICQFYKHMGWNNTISDKDADEGGDRGYSENKTPAPGQWGGWGDYYRDLMNASVAQNKTTGNTPLSAKPGITNTLWNGGSMVGDIANLFKDTGFKNAYLNAGGRNNVGIPVSDIHDWNNVTIMDFKSSAGDSAILRLKGNTDGSYLPPKWWEKYKAIGGESAGGPYNNGVHSWGDFSKIVDLKKPDGKTAALMSADNGNTICYLPPDWWEKFKSFGGAPAIGCPVSDVRKWEGGEIVDLKMKDGSTAAMMSTDGGKTVYYLHKELLAKYKALGGPAALGYPKSDWHAWSTSAPKVRIMDFAGKSGYTCAIMKEDSASNYYLVKGTLWKAYTGTAGNGASSYLGHPTGEEYKWKDGWLWWAKEYYRQNFKGGWCWARLDGSKYGNDKNFSTNK